MVDLSILSENEVTVYNALLVAAESSQTAPGNDDIAEMIGASSTSTVPQIINRLEAKGMVKVQRFQRSRIVCFPDRHLCTVEPSNTAQHWRDRPDRMPRPSASLIEQRQPDIAKAIIDEAVARRRSVSDFLADLTFIGWKHLQDQKL